MRIPATVAGLVTLLCGCAGLEDFDDRLPVSHDIEERMGSDLGPERAPGEAAIPEGVNLTDGIDEPEAVALALWNNAPFQEALEDLGFARADLIEAGLLQNPVLSVLFPLGPKQLEFALNFPLEALWLRPSREAMATLELERVSAALVQSGLDLIRDTRARHADVIRREVESELAAKTANTFDEMAGLFEARLRAGDVSELEAGLARVDALEARREAQRLREEGAASRERLREMLGLIDMPIVLTVVARNPSPPVLEPREELLERAWASRPDLRAAELALESAGERAGLASREIVALSGVLDANGPNGESLEVGPGLQTTLPIFNWNQGGRALADAGVRRAARRYVTVRHAIARELGEALVRVRQAEQAFQANSMEIIPELELSLERARKRWELGESSELPVLETEVRLLGARAAQAGVDAQLRVAWAELERSLGSRIESEDDR